MRWERKSVATRLWWGQKMRIYQEGESPAGCRLALRRIADQGRDFERVWRTRGLS